jgi:serine/threonine-protein kinase
VELKAGTRVTQAIRLLRPLGQGGMGRVWVADHEGLQTQVVVKFMADEVAEQSDAAVRFKREASVAASVKSPHVVQVFDHGITDGVPYIVMELLEGRDLADHLAKHGRMAPSDVANMIAQVAKALGKAHQVGVIHRDIKPENIFLCDANADGDGAGGEMFVKLLDFGIAKRDQLVEGSATTTGQVVGTPYYMSPEQIVGEKVIDARTDIWSLGVVAFEAITGVRPFAGTTVGAITLAIHTAKPKMTALVPGLPPALDEWFAKACAQDPAARFATAREAANALLVALGEAPRASLVRPPMMSLVDSSPALPSSQGAKAERAVTHLSSAYPVSRPQKRPPLALAIGAVGVIVVLAVLVVLAVRKPDAPTTASLPAADKPSAPAAPAPSESAAPAATTPEPAAAPEPAPSQTASVAAFQTPGKPAAPVLTPRPAATTTTKVAPRSTRGTKKRDDDDIK